MRAPPGLSTRAGTLLCISASLLLHACGDREPPVPAGPDAVALELFQLSRHDEPAAADLERLFADPAEGRRAALLDALTGLRAAREARVLTLQPLGGPDRLHLDLAAELDGGGQARYQVQMERSKEGIWRVTWFQGPGFDWPASSRRGGPGLSTSPAPK